MERSISIEITGIGSQMQGVGRLPDGRAVFVPGAIPGERALIEITKDAGRFANARLLHVENPSPKRQEPFCPRYGDCGGCSCQHMEYESTLSYKRGIVTEALSRIGGQKDAEVRETLGMAHPFEYRGKVEYTVAPDGTLGFAKAGSHAVSPGWDCPLAVPAIRETAECAQTWLRGCGKGTRLSYVVARANGKGEVCLTLCLSGGDARGLDALYKSLPKCCISVYQCRLSPKPAHALDGACRWLWGARELTEEICGLRFSLSPQSFFQVNREQCEKLMRIASGEAVSQGAEPVDIADVYCGVGSLSLAVAAHTQAKSVTGFEIVPQAIENAKANAKANGLDKKTRFLAGDAALTLPKEIAAGARFGSILVDPPRKGVDPRALEAILRAAPQDILYVSCNPATLARDIKILCEKYELRYAQPIDMFPWTEHVETVARLSINA